jgi:hypothetical protein
LKDEINRQTQRADASQHAKEQAQQARESLEEKMKNARVALGVVAPGIGVKRSLDGPGNAGAAVKEDGVRQSLTAALNILNS